MRKVEAYEASDGTLLMTKEDCVRRELVIMLAKKFGTVNTETACIVADLMVEQRADITLLLTAIDADEADEAAQ